MSELPGNEGAGKLRWRSSRLVRLALALLIVTALTPALYWVVTVLCGRNQHVVMPGKVYRGAQLSPADLESLVRRHGIRTVLNLRGCSDSWPWYRDECLTAQRLNINFVDIALSAYRFPHTEQLRELVEALERAEYPVYMHCRRGADRTGLAAAVLMLLEPGVPLQQAYRQLSLRYGHLALGKPAYLTHFLHIYRDWLHDQRQEHSPERFRRWAKHEYDGGWFHCRFTDFKHTDPKANEYITCALEARNTGLRPWHMKPVKAAGMHLNFWVRNERDVEVVSAHAGLLHATVQPNASIRLRFAIPPLPAGRYQLFATLEDAHNFQLDQTGSEPFEVELAVRN